MQQLAEEIEDMKNKMVDEIGDLKEEIGDLKELMEKHTEGE